MSLYSKFKTDPSKVTKGIKVQIDESIFIIRPMNNENKEYQKAMADFQNANRVQLKTNTISDEKLRLMVREIFCETVLVGWKNVADENGNLMEFNKENAVKLLTDLDFIYTTLLEVAADHNSFMQSVKESDLKN